MRPVMPDSTGRFSGRVENYIRYRPHYPPELIRTLSDRHGLTAASVVADVGSGTGILTELFLENGNRVLAVEPNREMREAAERLLGHHPGFRSVTGTAEATSLPDFSVDVVAAGQAFHWFDPERAREEFRRILRPPGLTVLIWNERRTGPSPFLAAYERLLEQYATDYAQVDHRRVGEPVLREFFNAPLLSAWTFPNRQRLDLDGLTGRLLSSSYAPEAGHRNHGPMLQELTRIFDSHQVSGQVVIEYETKMYCGTLVASG